MVAKSDLSLERGLAERKEAETGRVGLACMELCIWMGVPLTNQEGTKAESKWTTPAPRLAEIEVRRWRAHFWSGEPVLGSAARTAR